MKNISGATFQQFQYVFEKAVQEAYESGLNDGRKTVPQLASQPVTTNQPETVEHEGKLLRKVEREAREGDYIRPNDTDYRSHLKDGLTYGPVTDKDGALRVGEHEYRVYQDTHNRTKDTVEIFEVVESIPTIELQDGPPWAPAPVRKTPNQQRYVAIQRARIFVDENRLNVVDGRFSCRAEFKIDHKKRTVTCDLRGVNTAYVRKRAVARCHPNEVFNEEMGKVISLHMVMQKDIPEEFLNAVQPDEIVVGMVVEYVKDKRTAIVIRDSGFNPYKFTHINTANAFEHIIIDDTNAEYSNG